MNLPDEVESRFARIEDHLNRAKILLERAPEQRTVDDEAAKVSSAKLKAAMAQLARTIKESMRNNPRNGGSGSVQKS